jgi:hypothetical protein
MPLTPEQNDKREKIAGQMLEALMINVNAYTAGLSRSGKGAKVEIMGLLGEVQPYLETVATFVVVGMMDEAQRTVGFFEDGIVIASGRVANQIAADQRDEINQLIVGTIRSMVGLLAVVL